ncbi:PH domain-containing protein [Enterococcus quebecensis]|uniref:YokE-like PH domain-containing protein n=1 Tax=Enterococcus quebecensis TaxID=903983 RepID=A0A1E5GRT7_9ENTE|nr:PH domain-containing protein [Enterococcus quebecensis]OEG15448.1 hypothetical protein BCR23_08235 [Enterococcus quebecensis]
MNEARKLDNIREFFKRTNIESIEEKNFIFGYVEPKFWKYMVFQAGAVAVADMKNLLVFFTEEQIILVGLSLSGNFTENISYLDHKDIIDFKYKKGLIQTKIIFKYNDAKVIIKTPQVVLTSKWQMTNLQYLKEKNFFIQ